MLPDDRDFGPAMARLIQRQRIFVDVCSAASSRLRRRVEPATQSRARCEQVRMTAATFFAKTKMGWTERVVNKHAKRTANRS
jgi:hypothetical protein